ncbi:hypothetical protein [Rhizobium sullae]|uniref:Uncharacterized protein n=1 Tax=Rhizobium sullae TaxID=50338 RepID=A0A2N0DFZ0_RHISU|nr:hypothetical protein [Rhizobium sullae]PKA45022.1 hypothetical protein CWR43_04215 [Rhizobium sullae]UWU17467.1 hypothetical protein N2599_32525 [Rhizobium sullae]
MHFPRPRTEEPSLRFEEAKSAARNALEEVIDAANEAGWGTDEITVAMFEAARFLKEANEKDPDPAAGTVRDAAKEQIGRDERYD